MWLIAGLGNPGRKYSKTRHNIGFMVLDEFADRYNIQFTDRKEYRIGKGLIEDKQILIVEPLLYMNLSGIAINNIFKKYPVRTQDMIVVHDDLDMETGKIRIRKTGSSGGHKGIESIINNTGTKDFIRIKIGIGRDPDMPAEKYVLSKFNKDEITIIKDSINKAVDAIVTIINEGIDRAMNRFN